MEQFPHLRFTETIVGEARLRGGGNSAEQSNFNRRNRQQHSQNLSRSSSIIKNNWESHVANRSTQNLAPIENEVQPIFLEINPDLFGDLQFDLESYGIEIISEEDNGFIIGASLDNLRTLEQKITGFTNTEWATGKIADFWQIIEGNREDWKPQHVLTPQLFQKWNQIEDDEIYHLEVSIAFAKRRQKEPDRTTRIGETLYRRYLESLEERDNLLMERQNNFQEFIQFYEGGEITSSFIELEDSFGCSVNLSGKGLKDLVLNYQYVFEVAEIDEIESSQGTIENEPAYELETLPPEENSPEIGVIDSGIQEEHTYIEKAIFPQHSKSYVIGDLSTADKVPNGGHGTMVAGAILYPNGISSVPIPYQLPFFVRNLRVLDHTKSLQTRTPADLLTKIVQEHPECKIFNHSINSRAPFRVKHMSLWAATMDNLIHTNNVLFINSVGNKEKEDVRHFLQSGSVYPEFLDNPEWRIANPAQSSFSLAVGSINHTSLNEPDWELIGDFNEVSPFSRVGTGIWGMIKPDVVEYGGALKVSKNGLNNVTNQDVSIEHLRSTLYGGSAYGNDSIGTSLSAPKVTNIVAQLKKLYPEENINIFRALVIQGARLPNEHFENPTEQSIRYYGYGLPNLERVTKNTEHRITFYNTNTIRAEEGQVYNLKIPEILRGQGDEYNVLIEVTLAYTANVRRTRQKTKSYLGTWLSWECSKVSESSEIFKNRVLKSIAGELIDDYERTDGNILPWKLRNQSNWGEVREINRNNSTAQKDWAIVKSYELPEELSIAVIGHKGWDKQKEPVPYALTVSIEILGADIPIYEEIRIENEVEIPITN